MIHDKAAVSLNVASNIRRLRKARGLSIAKLAERCEELGAPWLQAASLSNIERNPEGGNPEARQARRVTVDETFVLAQALGTSLESLIAGESCLNCYGKPPRGFTCQSCGTPSEPSTRG